MDYPILYTFRRCPYAIRARMALAYSQINAHSCEVDLKNKPQAMLEASPKGSVPVLILEEGYVLDESMDIIRWALTQSDPDSWLRPELEERSLQLIHYNDREFKPILDKYKYSQHSDDANYFRDKAHTYLNQLNSMLANHRYLFASQITIADVAVFPFIRQFYMVDQLWFQQTEHKHLQIWLQTFLNSELFLAVMRK